LFGLVGWGVGDVDGRSVQSSGSRDIGVPIADGTGRAGKGYSGRCHVVRRRDVDERRSLE
jgi:hypothetical protein